MLTGRTESLSGESASGADTRGKTDAVAFTQNLWSCSLCSGNSDGIEIIWNTSTSHWSESLVVSSSAIALPMTTVSMQDKSDVSPSLFLPIRQIHVEFSLSLHMMSLRTYATAPPSLSSCLLYSHHQSGWPKKVTSVETQSSAPKLMVRTTCASSCTWM